MNSTKVGRNDLCLCGSGQKFKKCCLGSTNSMTQKERKPGLNQILEMLTFSLQNLSAGSAKVKDVNVKEVGLLNNTTLECKFYCQGTSSADIKNEMMVIISATHSFLDEDVFPNVDCTHYAVRAYDSSDDEQMYVITPKRIAKLASNGEALEWLKGSVFQENTTDYRLGIAKKQISEIENGFRVVISDRLYNANGSDWFDTCVNRDTKRSAKRAYHNKYGVETDDGSLLIDYTYIRDLKSIIVQNWTNFTDLFTDSSEFESKMDELNRIRREEGHNRNISEADLISLKQLYEYFLLRMTQTYWNIVPEFMVENWKTQLKEIMFYQPEYPYTDEEIQHEKVGHLKLLMSRANLECMIEWLEDKETRVKSIPVPVQKKETHDELLEILNKYRILHEELVDESMVGTADSVEAKFSEIENFRPRFHSFIETYIRNES